MPLQQRVVLHGVQKRCQALGAATLADVLGPSRRDSVEHGLTLLCGLLCAEREALLVERRQAREGLAPGAHHLLWRVVAFEKARFVVIVKRHQARHAARHARVTRKRRMLGLGQLQAGLEASDRGHKGGCADGVEGEGGGWEFHVHTVYRMSLTGS